MLTNDEQALKHHRTTNDLLQEIADDIHLLRSFFTDEPETDWKAVSSAHPLRVDKRNRKHLYILASVGLELFFEDTPGAAGSSLLTPIIIPAGRFVELPFRTGDFLTCPAIANNAEIVVYLLAQNEVLMQ